jgi:hypothetical protein
MCSPCGPSAGDGFDLDLPGATDGVCFLLVTSSLYKQRKVTRSRQRAKPKTETIASTVAAVESINSRSLADGSG